MREGERMRGERASERGGGGAGDRRTRRVERASEGGGGMTGRRREKEG